MKIKQSTKGYSLVEVLVAITILMLAIAGPLTIAAKGIQSTRHAKDQTTAFLLAQEGIEYFAAIRNEEIIKGVHAGSLSTIWDWTNNAAISSCFVSNTNTEPGCNVDFRDNNLLNSSSVVSCSNLSDCLVDYDETKSRSPYRLNNGTTANDTIFTRSIKLQRVNTNELKVVSKVTWESGLFGGQTQDVTLTSSLFKLYADL